MSAAARDGSSAALASQALQVDGVFVVLASFLASDQLVALSVGCKRLAELTKLRPVQEVWRIRFEQRWPFLKKKHSRKGHTNWLRLFRAKRDAEKERKQSHFRGLEARLAKEKEELTKKMQMEGASPEQIAAACKALDGRATHERRKSVHLMRGMWMYRGSSAEATRAQRRRASTAF